MVGEGSIKWKVSPASAFGRNAASWDAFVLGCGYPAFMRADVLASALSEFGTGKELVAVGTHGDRPIVMAVVERIRSGIWQTFQPSQIPLGAFVGDGATAIDAALAGLARVLPGFAVTVAITQQDPALAARPPNSPRLRTLDYIETARVEVSGTFDDYWTARGKNLRTNTKRQHAKLVQDGVSVRLDCIVDSHAVAAAISQYGQLESAGWKAGEGTAVAADNAQGRFYTRVFESCCARGSGRIYRLLFGGAVVAMDLCIEEAGVLVILKTAYDENWKHVSPASLMRHAYFRQVFDEGRVRRVEFYGKVMEWHRRWTNDVRTLYHVNHYRSASLRVAREWLSRVRARAGSQQAL